MSLSTSQCPWGHLLDPGRRKSTGLSVSSGGGPSGVTAGSGVGCWIAAAGARAGEVWGYLQGTANPADAAPAVRTLAVHTAWARREGWLVHAQNADQEAWKRWARILGCRQELHADVNPAAAAAVAAAADEAGERPAAGGEGKSACTAAGRGPVDAYQPAAAAAVPVGQHHGVERDGAVAGETAEFLAASASAAAAAAAAEAAVPHASAYWTSPVHPPMSPSRAVCHAAPASPRLLLHEAQHLPNQQRVVSGANVIPQLAVPSGLQPIGLEPYALERICHLALHQWLPGNLLRGDNLQLSERLAQDTCPGV